MTDFCNQFQIDLEQFEQLDSQQRTSCLQRTPQLDRLSIDQVDELLGRLIALAPPEPGGASDQMLMSSLLARLARRFRAPPEAQISLIPSDSTLNLLGDLYRHLGLQSVARHCLLGSLTADSGRQALELLADLLVTDPPLEATQVELQLAPLFQCERPYPVEALFPRLLDGIGHPNVANAIIELANYLSRQQLVEQHPATSHQQQLSVLLGELTEHLAKIEEGSAGNRLDESQQSQISTSVALVASLCDATGLIGNKDLVGKLYRALELGHRRIRVEAAAALAKLEEKQGEKTLIAMAAEPAVRMRVLAYAEELGLLDEIDAEHRSPVSQAEAELVSWLTQPERFGLAPQQCELVDSRSQHWPGFEEKVMCYLIRFTYRIGDAEHSNVGIVGPAVHAIVADLTDLPPNDIYGVFAGWQAEHAEIGEVDAEQIGPSHRAIVETLTAQLAADGYESIELVKLGLFFEDRILVATAEREGVAGSVIHDGQDTWWYPRGASARPLGPGEAYFLYVGRKLLDAFNPEDDS